MECINCHAPGCTLANYNIKKSLCLCCDEILRGGTKQCLICHDFKDITLFKRSELKYCKECTKATSKAIYDKNNYLVKCECGSTIKNMSMSKHIKTKKHLEYIKQQ